MEEKYIITCRYERLTKDGKEFTEWFDNEIEPISKADAELKIKELKSNVKVIDQKTKLKHEFSIKPYSVYVAEQKEIQKCSKELIKAAQEYRKSDEYKLLQKKKRQAAKERKERQKIYLEEHNI